MRRALQASRLLTHPQLWQHLSQVVYFGQVIDPYIRIVGVMDRVVLVVVFSRIKASQGDDLGYDSPGIDLRLVELVDISLGDAFLLVVGIKDRRTILSPVVRSLAI